VRPPDLMSSEWRCLICGPVPPLHVAEHINSDIIESVTIRAKGIPVWCPWPLPTGWMVTGIGWAGDDRSGTRATALACSGPGPLGGPADVLFVAEEPGVGLGNRYAGLTGTDPGPYLQDALESTAAHAKVRAAGWPTALWAVGTPVDDRSTYVGEAKGMWLYAIAWPASAGYLFAEDLVLHDLTDWLPGELVYGAPSPVLHGAA
jgi:hypothetical protein